MVGANGQPLSGVSVGPAPSADGGQCNTVYDDTDADGRFALRIMRMHRPMGSSDSVSLWIRAAVRPVPPEVNSTIIDRTLVRVGVASIGGVPSPVVATIVLPVE